jgi:parallel beta-helix repeat protein
MKKNLLLFIGLFASLTLIAQASDNIKSAYQNKSIDFVQESEIGIEFTSLTNGLPKESLGAGRQTDEVTEPNNWRWSEKYYGYHCIKDIVNQPDACGAEHIYVIGVNNNATVEYRMKFGDEYSTLVLRGIADAPAPVEMEIFVDGILKSKATWKYGDNCNELTYVSIPDINFDSHFIAIRFSNDYYDPGQGTDRNFYLDGLMVISNEKKGIPVFVGDDIQAAVNNNPPGTTFIIKATDWFGITGIHRMQQIIPKDGNSFIGEDGAILNGAMEIVNNEWKEFRSNNGRTIYYNDGLLKIKLHNEVYDDITHGYIVCSDNCPCYYPEDLFMDNMFCRQVNSIEELENSIGSEIVWYFERDNPTDGVQYDGNGNKRIYVNYTGSDLRGHIWEISLKGYAFGGPRISPPEWPPKVGETRENYKFPETDKTKIPKNITIRNLTIEKYACPGQFGAIGFQDPGDNWTIEDNEVRLNHGAGIVAGSNSKIRNNKVNDNGQIGIKVSSSISAEIFNTLIEGNEISRNRKKEVGFNMLWEAGGTKFAKTTNLTVRNNIVRENNGPGLWTDVDNLNTLYENNIVEDNLDNGIFHEISYDATIRNNIVRRNGIGRTWDTSSVSSKMMHAQIMVSTSENVEVYNNIVDTGEKMNGIIVRNDYRHGSKKEPNGLYKSKNVSVHHNKIIVPQGNDNGISGGWTNTVNYNNEDVIWRPEKLSTTGHNFDFDIYQLADLNKNRWIWENGDGNNQLLSFQEFQAVKQELNGKTNSILTIENGYGLPGSVVKGNVNLENTQNIAGVQFTLIDNPDHLNVKGVSTTARTSGFTAVFFDDGTNFPTIAIYSSARDVIPPGEGPIAEITYEVDLSALAGQSSLLQLNNVILSDPKGASVPVDLVNGIFYFSPAKGDVNGDGTINIIDLVRTINIILGVPPEATESEIYTADCNLDNKVDIRDVVFIINLIYNDTQQKSGLVVKSQNGNTIELKTENLLSGQDNNTLVQANLTDEIAGLQLRISYDPKNLILGKPAVTGRTSGMTLSTQFKDGELIILMYSLNGSGIKPGDGPILSIPSTVNSDAQGITGLQIKYVVLVGTDAREIPVSIITGINGRNESMPKDYSLNQNYPNPFKSETFIKYGLPKSADVQIKVYNLLGQEIRNLVSEHKEAGFYTVTWDALDNSNSKVSPGIYIYEFTADDNFINKKKMIVLK